MRVTLMKFGRVPTTTISFLILFACSLTPRYTNFMRSFNQLINRADRSAIRNPSKR